MRLAENLEWKGLNSVSYLVITELLKVKAYNQATLSSTPVCRLRLQYQKYEEKRLHFEQLDTSRIFVETRGSGKPVFVDNPTIFFILQT
jgi:hypothetical protein